MFNSLISFQFDHFQYFVFFLDIFQSIKINKPIPTPILCNQNKAINLNVEDSIAIQRKGHRTGSFRMWCEGHCYFFLLFSYLVFTYSDLPWCCTMHMNIDVDWCMQCILHIKKIVPHVRPPSVRYPITRQRTKDAIDLLI